MTASTPTNPAAANAAPIPPGLSHEELQELDDLLDDARTRDDEVPQWEFCDGFIAALVCTRRPIALTESLPMLLGDGVALEDAIEHHALPLLPAFKDAAQQARFIELWQRRYDEVAAQLAQPIESLEDEAAYYPEVMDLRAIIATLPEAERGDIEGHEIPSFAQVWALGFMFAVENWPEEWQPPRDKEAAQWIDDALLQIVSLTEDDTGAPEVHMLGDDAPDTPPSISRARVEMFGDAIWACYDLRQVWHSLGPRVETYIKPPTPGRNEPCWCGSGKKYKKCHGA